MARKPKEIIAKTNEKLEKLKNIDPFLIDLSLRENPVGARVGMTLEDKVKIFPLLRDFGFKHILLGTLDYGMPDELEVDDDFMMYLRDQKIDMTGCYAFTQIGLADETGLFTPDPSMTKLRDYKVPNTIHEIYVSDDGIGTQYGTVDPVETLERSLPRSIAWLHKHIKGDHGKEPRIIINLVDGCDGFACFLERTCDILKILAKQPIEGVSFEDDRGTYLPFQVGAYAEIARSILGPSKRLMVHMHAGGGFENAAVLEALIHGADGVWAGLPKRAAIIGHASLGELMANLLRVGNRHLKSHHYKFDQLLSLATTLQVIDEEERVPDDLPILGNNAYRLPLTFFQQKAGRFMDLAPEAIGGKYRYRICPVVSDTGVIAGRLGEVTGCRPEEFSKNVLEQMIRLMRRDLRAGKRIVYDEPENLLALYARATVTMECGSA